MEHMTELDDAIGELWNTFAPTARARVDVLENYLGRLKDGTAETASRMAAASSAHKLAGALGSFQRPGSDQAAALEELLRETDPVDAADAEPLVVFLRAVVTPP